MTVHMDGLHPTIDGTKTLLGAINEDVRIIINHKFITCDHFYQGVEAVFQYGCLTCRDYLLLDEHFICQKCRAPDPPAEQSPPPEVDVLMQEARDKRLLADKDTLHAPDAKRSHATTTDDGGAN